LRRRSESGTGTVRVFTIAYGEDANADALTSIADASGGEEYTGEPDEITAVYRQISSFFRCNQRSSLGASSPAN